ncbi:magnesium transporter [bacterium]|nr:magnesium transporter [bacterium]
MSTELTKELSKEIIAWIESGQTDKAVEAISDLHPYDIAEIVSALEEEYIPTVFENLQDDLSAEVLSELDEDLRLKFIAAFSPRQIYQRFLRAMDSDDAADLINDLPQNQKKSVTDFLREEIKSEAADIISLLKYDEDTAGGLMAKELVRVNVNWTVNECIDEIRKQADEVESVYAVYVVDDLGKLVGLVPLSKLIISKSNARISQFYDPKVVYVSDTDSAQTVAEIMGRYNFVAMPVVDFLGRLVGRITIDDVVDFMREEAEEDYQLASGLSENVEYSDTVWVLSRARLPWLFLGLLGGIASSKVIGLYEDDIQVYPEMALFIPLIAAMGGNAGVQSSAIVVQSLASKNLLETSLLAKLGKELRVALINAMLCAMALLSYGMVANDSMSLSVTISIALFSVIIIASILGALIPLILNGLKIDPALATGPFITTTNDLMGLGIYFFIGRLMYGITF